MAKQNKIYGDFLTGLRLPFVYIGINGVDSLEVAEQFWRNYSLATRAGSLRPHKKTRITLVVRV